MHITIKQMESDDEIRGKAYVHRKSWQEAYQGIVSRNYLDSLTREKCEAIAFRYKENILIAKDGERVIGFAGYGAYRNDELENTGEIYAIYLLAEYHGHGIGRRLMQAALEKLKKYPRTALWVLKDNTKAISFYERCGFKADGRQETIHLGTDVIEIRMTKQRSGEEKNERA